MANTPLAEILRARPPLTREQAEKLLGLSARSIARMIEAGQLAAPTRFGTGPNAPKVFDLEDVLGAHVRRVLGLDREDQDDDVDDPALFDRTEATG